MKYFIAALLLVISTGLSAQCVIPVTEDQSGSQIMIGLENIRYIIAQDTKAIIVRNSKLERFPVRESLDSLVTLANDLLLKFTDQRDGVEKAVSKQYINQILPRPNGKSVILMSELNITFPTEETYEVIEPLALYCCCGDGAGTTPVAQAPDLKGLAKAGDSLGLAIKNLPVGGTFNSRTTYVPLWDSINGVNQRVPVDAIAQHDWAEMSINYTSPDTVFAVLGFGAYWEPLSLAFDTSQVIRYSGSDVSGRFTASTSAGTITYTGAQSVKARITYSFSYIPDDINTQGFAVFSGNSVLANKSIVIQSTATDVLTDVKAVSHSFVHTLTPGQVIHVRTTSEENDSVFYSGVFRVELIK